MKITYDKKANAAYIYLRKGKIADTEMVGRDFIVDLDKQGRVIGIEILDADENLGILKDKPIVVIGRKSIPLSPLAP